MLVEVTHVTLCHIAPSTQNGDAVAGSADFVELVGNEDDREPLCYKEL